MKKSRTLSTEEHKESFNPQGAAAAAEAVEANKPYFPSWKKVTDGLQVNEGEALNDAIWRHMRRQKGVGTGFGGAELYSDHLAVVTEVDVEDGGGPIGVCSFNISFQISDAKMWAKSFPSEVAATTVLNGLHAEAVAAAAAAAAGGGAAEN